MGAWVRASQTVTDTASLHHVSRERRNRDLETRSGHVGGTPQPRQTIVSHDNQHRRSGHQLLDRSATDRCGSPRYTAHSCPAILVLVYGDLVRHDVNELRAKPEEL
jgi:hypothetical protein